jgi:dUTP pyrophosphatase
MGYRGELEARFKVTNIKDLYNPQDRICQMIILPFPIMKPEWADTLEDSDRGNGGFGSSGN